ncbi:Putative C-1-tetrahydrofolate synthase, cytoplasmic [Rhizopus microsporus]|nr:Putative C-1-tetrahydrofolate synthase, cytoplasmic [Rhizopus microsporus]
MTATIIDGKAIAQSVRDQVKSSIANTKQTYPQFDPRLAILLVGSRSDSTTYVKTKDKAANEVGISIEMDKLPETISQEDLLAKIKQLNLDDKVHGILVQMPLPSHIDEDVVLESIDYKKDVDG